MAEVREDLDGEDRRKQGFKLKLPGGVELEARGLTVVMTLVLAVMVANSVLLWNHLVATDKSQELIVSAIRQGNGIAEQQAIAARFQACLIGVDQKDRALQLRAGSACWYMARGYEFEPSRKPAPYQ